MILARILALVVGYFFGTFQTGYFYGKAHGIDVPDGMAKLRTIYPNLMRLEYDNKRTRSAADIGTAERVEEKSELELFREFYELQNNQSMTAQQEALVEELLRGMKG